MYTSVCQARDAELGAHAALLCARSDFFSAMLRSSDFCEGQEFMGDRENGAAAPQRFNFDECDTLVVQTSLRWMYSDRLDRDLPPETLLEASTDAVWIGVPHVMSQGL